MKGDQVQTPQAITDNGWQYYDKCRCGGILQYKYRHSSKPGFEIRWLIKYFKFKITQDNKLCVGLTKMEKLDETLKST